MKKFIYKGKIRSTASGKALIPGAEVLLPTDDSRVSSLVAQGLLMEVKEKNINNQEKKKKDVS